MGLGKVPIKAGGGAKWNVSIKQGTQVFTATTTRHRHTEKLSGDTYQPVYLPWPAKRQTATQMHKYELEIARPPERLRVI